jgi:hypothetical protein
MKSAFSFSPSLVEVVSESLMLAIAWVRLRFKMRRVRIRVRCRDRTDGVPDPGARGYPRHELRGIQRRHETRS